jgi:putative colanic acid biosynthesis glycosyltransferase
MGQNEQPFFSIVTITLNDLAGFRATRSSVEEQSTRDFEWLVIDGASTDGTAAELEASTLPNLSYVSEKDNGLYNAMNKGLSRCRGRYTIFMNSADCFAGPKVLEAVKQRVLDAAATPDLVFGDALERTEDSKLLLKKARTIEWLNYGMHTHHQAILYSAAALAGIQFDESFRVAGDYDLTCKIYARGGSSLALDLPICIFSRGGVSETKSHVARSENWRVQRDVLRHTLSRRLLTKTAYLASFVVRTKFRPTYDRLRFQHDHSQS